jgi:UDP-2-acetamido-3-amino-2,3-dideoxy-glucuronate N-acetyltransferase
MTPTTFFAHSTAVVDDGCEIGARTKIWHFSHVMTRATIGNDCTLGQNVFVASGVRIGDRVKIQNNVSIYDGVVLEDDVFCGPSCVFTNVRHPRSEMARRGSYERTLVRRGASIGANATIICGSVIGRYAFVAAGAVVPRGEVSDYARVMGVPGRRTGWVSRHGHALRLPDASGIMRCPESGWRYQEVAGILRCLDWAEDRPMPEPR